MKLRVHLEMMLEIPDREPVLSMARIEVAKRVLSALAPLSFGELINRIRVIAADEVEPWEPSDDGWEG